MICNNCQFQNEDSFKFCNNCGTKLSNEIVHDYNKSINKTYVSFFTLLAYVSLIHILKYENSYITEFIKDGIFIFIVVVLYIVRDKSLNLFIFRANLNWKIIIGIVVSMPIMAFGVSLLSKYINSFINENFDYSYFEIYKSAPIPLISCLFSVALVPAIFEEIAFRGLIFNDLKNVTTIKATLIITSVLFTILHFSVISFLWIFPLGLFFGYLRARYNHLFYGIIGHFIYNSSVILIEYLTS